MYNYCFQRILGHRGYQNTTLGYYIVNKIRIQHMTSYDAAKMEIIGKFIVLKINEPKRQLNKVVRKQKNYTNSK